MARRVSLGEAQSSKSVENYLNKISLFTIMTTEIKRISDKLDVIQSDLAYLKQHIVDFDSVLTDDDLEALKEADKDLKSGKTKRL